MDRTLFRWINNLAGSMTWANGVVSFYAKAGIALFGVFLLVAYLWGRRDGDMEKVAGAVWAGAAALVGLGVAQLIGGAIDRARPYDTLTNVHVLVSRTTDFSFPSDHATVSGAVAIGVYLVNRRWGIAAIIAAIVMAVARVYCGAHYPSDVAAGLIAGGVVAAVGHVVVVPALTKLARRLVSSPVRPLLTASK